MKFILRNATLKDLDGLAAIYHKCYHDAYDGILPAPVLEEVTFSKSQKKWRAEFVEQITDADRAIFVIENEIGTIVGFANCGAAKIRSLKQLGQGELFHLHVEAEHQGFGLGKALMLACARWLISRGLFSGGVWIHEENGIGRRFCEDLGARSSARKRQNMRGFGVQLIGFSWADLSQAAQLEAEVPNWGATRI